MYKKIINRINSCFKKIVLLFFTIISIGLMSQADATAPPTPPTKDVSTKLFLPLLKAVNSISVNTQQSSNEIRAAVQLYNLQKYAASLSSQGGAASGSAASDSAADWAASLQETAQNTKVIIQKNVDNHFTQINNELLVEPDNSALGEDGYSTPDPTAVYTPNENLFAMSLATPGSDSLFKAGSSQTNGLGHEVMKQLIIQVKKKAKDGQKDKVSDYMTALMNSPQNGSFNFESLFSPKDDMYPDDKSDAVAKNYLSMLNSNYSMYYDQVFQQFQTVGEHIPKKASNKKNVINYYVAIMGNKDVQHVLLGLRKSTALRSIVSSTLLSLYEERKKQSSGKSQLAMEREAVVNAKCGSGQCINIVLQQNYQAHIDRENIIALLSVIASNGMNSNNLSHFGDIKKIHSVIKSANNEYPSSKLTAKSTD